MSSIGKKAFEDCTSLESIELPSGVKSIGKWAFIRCTSLENITFSGTREQWGKINKGSQWNEDIPAETVHCIDGDAAI